MKCLWHVRRLEMKSWKVIKRFRKGGKSYYVVSDTVTTVMIVGRLNLMKWMESKV